MMQPDPNLDQQPANRVAGGFFIAAGLLGGAVAGVYFGEPSIGMVAGLGFGILVALGIWFRDRGKK